MEYPEVHKMFGDNFKICVAIAESISSAHHIWVAGGNFSYITLNGGGLIFTSNQEKFQIVGHPSVKWKETHFIDTDKTAKELVREILDQVSEYEREGKTITSAETWFVEMETFTSKKREWNKQFWLEDIEKLEIEWWADCLDTQENPIFQDLAIFLKCHLEDDSEEEINQHNPHFRELLVSEIEAANKLARFLSKHSNKILSEGANFIPQWVEAH